MMPLSMAENTPGSTSIMSTIDVGQALSPALSGDSRGVTP